MLAPLSFSPATGTIHDMLRLRLNAKGYALDDFLLGSQDGHVSSPWLWQLLVMTRRKFKAAHAQAAPSRRLASAGPRSIGVVLAKPTQLPKVSQRLQLTVALADIDWRLKQARTGTDLGFPLALWRRAAEMLSNWAPSSAFSTRQRAQREL